MMAAIGMPKLEAGPQKSAGVGRSNLVGAASGQRFWMRLTG